MAITGRSDKAEGKIKYGMVGGGEGAFIGAVHRLAARMDDHYELVAGALSSSPEKATRSAKALGIAADRSYGDYEAMAAAEKARKDGIEAVAIVTPNHVHVPAARAFIKSGIHVICDKPLSTNLKDAIALEKLVKASGLVFCLTHNYTGYPMVRHARQMVADGDLGELRIVQVEYPQDWLTEPIEKTGQKQAAWRTDPKLSGGGAIGDIGTHAHNLAGFVSGLDLDSVLSDVDTFVKGRKVDDNVNVLLRYKGGAKGMLWASQVAVGNENNVKLRVYGTKGGLEWHQEHPNHLHWFPYGQPPQLLTRGSPAANAAAGRVTRVPPGHPEGYLEGFANIYTEAAAAIRAARSKKKPDKAVIFPTITDGVKGMAFIEAVLKSSAKGGKWVKLTA
ncbi:Gfo/Idh/MocA family protein [Dongia sedimenti]|uniref:Gfo/Idh/MocA family oxidoreductase n=1 Tax=Dongia sedimenti TaxID=3064282 RepID=A0ABU0YW17_9PROT|nr:Gfo/Idh/MocA family oxidoreductase [Rhodospirillaceae bacterium R-7]